MFREVIRSTAMTSEAAGEYFYGKVYGEDVRGDISFVSTLRALLCSRLDKAEQIYFYPFTSTKSKDYYRRNDAVSAIHDTTEIYDDRSFRANRFYYHRFESVDPEAQAAGIDCFEKSFLEAYDGWERVERVTDFFVKKTKVVCFINRSIKSVYLITGAINMRMFHYLQCGIFAMLPWYFPKEKGVTKEEMDVINSLREKEPQGYLDAIKAITDKLDFRGKRICNLLKGFESEAFKRQLEINARDIESLRERVAQYYRSARETLQRQEELEIRSLGLMAKIDESGDSTEYMDYFLANKNLTLVNCDGADVEIIVKGYISFYDEDIAETMIQNIRGIMYRGVSDEKRPWVQKVWREIFLEKRFKIRVCAYYKLTRHGVEVRRGYNFGDEFRDCTPNTHIDRYSCLGSYEEAINSLLYEGDYISATEQCLASCQSLNFADSVVLEDFSERLNYDQAVNTRCIELPDGTIGKMEDAVRWLKDEAEAQEKAQEGQNG